MIKEVLAFIFLDMGAWCILTATLFKGAVCFNPIENYEMWDEMNWIGVWVYTIFYWIVFLPISIFYWVALGIYTLFTFGRR